MSEDDEDIHEIEKAIILDEDSPIRRMHPDKKELPLESRLDHYIFNCSQSLSSISASIEKADISILLLESAYEDCPESEKITPAEFVEYAIENYFIRSATIYDRCLIFVNRLLDLGIANDSIGHQLLVTNEHVKAFNLESKLRAIRKECTEYRVERNKIVHHGRYSDDNFTNISAMHKANFLSEKEGLDPVIPPETVDYYMNNVIETQKQEFINHLDKIKEKVKEFYDSALPIYGHKKKELSA